MQAIVAPLVAVIMAVLGTVSPVTEDFLALTNADRSANGLAPLTRSSDLQVFAQLRAEEMMRTGLLLHTPTLGTSVTNWALLGENVGRGATLPNIEAGFMASPTHRANILRPEFSQAGAGVAWDGVSRFYVAVIFRQPMTAAGANVPVPAVRAALRPRTTSPPAPAPVPAPAPSEGPSGLSTATAPATAVPALPPPSPEPAPAEQPVPAAASPALGWVLQTTRADSMAPPAAPETGLGTEDGSSPPLLTTAAILAVVSAWIGVMAVARRRRLTQDPLSTAGRLVASRPSEPAILRA